MRAPLLLAPLALAACMETSRVDLPDVPGAKSALLLLPAAKDGTFGVALDLEHPGASAGVSLDESEGLFALLYPWTLAEMSIEPGPLGGDGGASPRPLPITAHAFALAGPRGERRWESTTSSTSALASLRIAGVERAKCEAAGGCARRLHGQSYCETPCTAPNWLETVTPPELPELPRFSSCPEGWSRWVPNDVVDGVSACLPPERVECAAGEAQFITEVSCARVGRECPSGQWPDGLSPDTLRVAAPTAGRCVPAAPLFCSIQDAIDAAPEGATIVLGKGRYAERVHVAKNVTITGACAAETVIAPPAGIGIGPLVVLSATVALGELTLTAPGEIALGVGTEAVATLRDVVIDRAATTATIAGTLDAERLLVTDATEGLYVAHGRLALRRAVITRSLDFGVRSKPGARVVIEDSVVERGLGRGGDRLNLACARPGDTKATPYAPLRGAGVLIEHAPEARIARTLLDANVSDGLGQTESALELEDVVIRGSGQTAIQSCTGSLHGTRLVLAENGVEALYGDFTDLHVEDAVVVDQGDTAFQLLTFGRNRIERAYVDRAVGFGLLSDFGGVDDALELESLWIRRVRVHADPDTDRDGDGMSVRKTGKLDLRRVRIEDVASIGGLLYADGTLEMADLAIARTGYIGLTLQCDPVHYTPSCLSELPRATVTRARIEDATAVGIYAAASSFTLTDVVVTGTKKGDGNPDFDAGLRAKSDVDGMPATISANRFAFIDNASIGVAIAPGGAVDLHQGEVAGNPVGVSIVPLALDPERIEDEVVYRDNDVDVQTVE